MAEFDQHEGIADARLAAIVDSSFDAIISKDLNSVIQTWNRAAERLFGYTADEVIGQSVLVLIPETHRGEEIEILTRLKRGEIIESFETIRRHKDGHLLDVSLTISPIRDRNGRIVGASKIARDNSRTKESERRIRMLMREVNHRVKNQYAVILSIIRETSKRMANPEEFETLVRERIMALSRSHDLLVNGDWRGASLAELARHQLSAYGHEELVSVSGPDVTLLPNAVQNIGMAFHELGTNSAKHGVLASASGKIAIQWSIEHGADGEAELVLTWTESCKGPFGEIKVPRRQGFGTIVLTRVAPMSLSGTAELKHEDDGSLSWSLRAPVTSTLVGYRDEDDADL